MAVESSRTDRPKSDINALLPSLLIGGPVWVFMSIIQGQTSKFDWLVVSFAFIGLAMLILGLTLLLIKQRRLEKRLDELERLKN